MQQSSLNVNPIPLRGYPHPSRSLSQLTGVSCLGSPRIPLQFEFLPSCYSQSTAITLKW